jgi:chromosome segregation ATPase
MTGEEMERAIEFLLQGQANLQARIAETNRIVQLQAETQSEFIQIVTSTFERMEARQTRLEEMIAETNRSIAESNARAADSDARLDRLAALVERNISGGNGNS